MNGFVRNVAGGFFAALLMSVPAFAAGTGAKDAQALLDKTGLHGGLCLVIGAKDVSLADALAEQSALYVQVLQSDEKLAQQWGDTLATSSLRERVGVRDAAFEPAHYGSSLLNLVVIEDVAAVSGAKPEDIARILVPNGVLAFRAAAPDFSGKANSAGLVQFEIPGFAAAFKRTPPAWTWKPSDSLKWRAGMRAHMAFGVCGTTFGSGRFYYREQIEAAGGWPTDTSQLVCRDAYNGRVLWIKQEEVPFKQWGVNQWSRSNLGMAADESGRLFVVTRDKRLVCLDGATGEERFVLLPKGAGNDNIQVWQEKYVVYGGAAGGSVFTAADGKLLWKWRGPNTCLHDDLLLESDGSTLWAKKLADGTELFKADLSWRADRKKKGMEIYHCDRAIVITEGSRWDRPFMATGLSPTTGEKLWQYQYGGIFGLPAHAPKGQPSFGDTPRFFRQDNTFVAYAVTPYFYETKGEEQKETHFTSIDLATGKPIKEDYGATGKLFGNACGGGPTALGDYIVYHLNVWLNTRTLERRFPYLVHPCCFLQSPTAYGMIYNSPGRKGGSIQGITATGPADIEFDQQPGGKLFTRYAPRPAFADAVKPGDWPTFRGGNARNSATTLDLGVKLQKLWETQIGLGGQTYGRMESERVGLTQATIAYDTAYVADIDAQRVVAVNVADGKQRWAHHLGSRADFPPTLYKGLCLVATKDGFVHCLDAKTGAAVYKLLVAPRERFIGGQEKLESLWPTAADVMVDAKGIAHASAGFASTIHGGNREVAFNPEAGEVVESKVNFEPFAESSHPAPSNNTGIYTEPLPGGWRLVGRAIDDMLGYGNDISRVNEDRAEELFGDRPGGKYGVEGRVRGRVIAFDDNLCVGHYMTYGGQAWDTKNPLFLQAVDKDPKKPIWKSEPSELIADDLVLGPKFVYVVGHYRRVKGDPEIWIVSREDGKVQAKTPVDGFPAFFGTSAAGGKLFLATRDGKLICYQGGAR